MAPLTHRRSSFTYQPQLFRTALLASLLLATSVLQLAVAEDIDAVSVFEEPSHKIIFTNDLLSVYRVDIQAKEDKHTLYHYHENDQLTVLTIDSSGFDQRLGEEAQRFEAPVGTLLFTSYSSVKPVPHRVSVPAGEQFGVVGVEFFAPPSEQMEKRFSAPAEAQFEIPHAKVRRLEFKGEESLASNTLLISLEDNELNIDQEDAPLTWKASRGDIYWLDNQASDARISAVEPANLIVITINPR